MKASTMARIDVINTAKETERRVILCALEYEKMGQRKGQALMNALHHVAPELYDILSGSVHDCFYSDAKLADTMLELGFSRKTF